MKDTASGTAAAPQQVDIRLTQQQAKAVMKEGPMVHTFVVGLWRAGCDMEREAIHRLIEQCGGGELTTRCGLGHELAVMQDGCPLHVETDADRVAQWRQEMLSAGA